VRPATRNELLFDVAAALVVLAGTLVLLAAGDGDVGAGAVALAAAASLPLVARRRAPLGVFLATGIATCALRLAVEPAGPPLGPTLALYWMVAAGDESRSRTRLMAAAAVAVLAGHLAATAVADDRFPLAETLWGVAVWGGIWLAGDRARLRRQRMAELEERALRAEREAERERRLAAAEERTRIARDLHDSAGHAMNVILVHAGLGRMKSDETTRETFATIEEVARETVGEIDQMVHALREDSESSGEVEPPPGLAAVDGLVARHREAGLDVTASVRGDAQPLPPGVDQGAYRILQEALTNAARHGAGSARVTVSFGDGAVDIAVANPLPATPPGDNPGGGHGLAGMRERAALLGGTLEAGPTSDGYRLHARLPLRA
jgi:signal transduction histidine kinase